MAPQSQMRVRFVNGAPMNLNVFNENFDEEDLMERMGGGEGGENGGLRQNVRDALPTLKFKKDSFKNAGVEN